MDKSRSIIMARDLRNKQTEAEKMLWLKVRNLQLNGVKFRRQQPIGQYIVDFVSFEKKLVIEVDGGQHNEPSTAVQDNERTLWLEDEGYKVIRFWNNEILENMEGVLTSIMEEISHPHPNPLPSRERVK